MTGAELPASLLLPVGLGLLAFIEPCAIGATLLFIKLVEGQPPRVKLAQALGFMLTRGLLMGLLGAGAAWMGGMVFTLQKIGWLVFGGVYAAIGLMYLTGRVRWLQHSFGPRLSRLGRRGRRQKTTEPRMSLHRLTPPMLQARLGQAPAPLLLDVRRSEAFRRNPSCITGAIPVLLDEAAPRIPDLPRTTPVVVYCLCSGQASSTRVALWLQAAGYADVSLLEGGLPAWQDAGLPLAAIASDARERIAKWIPGRTEAPTGDGRLIAEQAFLAGVELPARREMAVLFVDMVDSTRLLFSKTPEEVLRLVQAFMEVVVDVAVQHCGDVHDFEGDGAMLYFAGPGEAVPAAFNLRAALAAKRHCEPDLPQARFALDAGPLIVGYIGSRERRALSFIGPSINAAARILKLAPPGGIVVTDAVLRHAHRTDPDLAAQFTPLPEKQALKGFTESVTVHMAASECRERGHGGRPPACAHGSGEPHAN